MKRLIPVLFLAVFPTATFAQTDSESNQPYDFQVVLKCGAHNWLGKQFRDDLRNNLAGMLQDALGPMAVVAVFDLKETPPDQWQPSWKAFDAKGFAALDGPQELGGIKTHFLRIDFVNGQYELQTRQVDGSTGWVSPWRRERTADRAYVPRLAGKMIGQDFGLIGTVVGKSDVVQVQFKGASLQAPIDRWVKKGDVFALFRVLPKNSRGKIISEQVSDSVIHITENPKDGAASGRVVFRGRENPIARGGSAGSFRCVKLSTANAPMRLRLIDEKGQPHVRALQVYVHSQAFQESRSSEEEMLNPDRGGMFVSKKAYDQLAFVRVVTGSAEIARFPAPILDDREVTVMVRSDPKSEQAGELYSLQSELLRMYTESWLLQVDRYKEILKQENNAKALERAEATRRALDDDLDRLRTRMAQVKKEIGSEKISLADCEQLDARLDQHRERLNRRIGQLKEFIALDNAPDRAERRVKLKGMHNKALALVESFDYDAALEAYRQIVKEFPEETVPKKEMETLENAWRIKSDAHRQAREFIFKDWSAVKSADDIAAKLPTAVKKFQVCVDAEDKLTLAKLRATLPEIGKLLADEITALTKDGDADMDKINKLKKLVGDFQKFNQDVEAASKTK